MKKCPFCAEEIQDAAILCRYCGRELTSPKPKNWKYLTLIFHFRNADESGWVNAEGTPPASAAQHFWNQLYPMVAEADRSPKDDGWDVIEPRDPSCLKLEIVRNSKGYDPVRSVVGAIFTVGGSLITQAMGFQKWWISSLTLRYRKSAEETKEEINNVWMNIRSNNEWERMEQEPITQKWYIWRRPKDFDNDNPDDDRWDKIPIDENQWGKKPEIRQEVQEVQPSIDPFQVTAEEEKIIKLLAKGLSNPEIAERLNMSPVHTSLITTDLLNRFGVVSKDELARIAKEKGIFASD